jgi:hypothetical protein
VSAPAGSYPPDEHPVVHAHTGRSVVTASMLARAALGGLCTLNVTNLCSPSQCSNPVLSLVMSVSAAPGSDEYAHALSYLLTADGIQPCGVGDFASLVH